MRIEELSQKIKVVARFKGSDALYYVKAMNPKRVEYAWSPEKDNIATGLIVLSEITIYYPYTLDGFYKPSMATVLAQIPDEFIDQTVAYELIENTPYLEAFNDYLDIIHAGYNLITARLYTK